MPRIRRSLILLAVALGAALPASATAVVPTHTAVTSPTAADFNKVFQYDDGTPSTVTVSGTSDGTSGTLSVQCWYLDPDGTPETAYTPIPATVAADGSWSATLRVDRLTYCPGELRAVPNTLTPATAADLVPFTGPRALLVSRDDERLASTGNAANDGQLYNFYVQDQQDIGFYDFVSAGECGIDDGYVTSGETRAPFDFYCNGGFFRDIVVGGSTSHRSGILLDGHNAFLSGPAAEFGEGFGGFPFLTLSHTYDPTSGNLTLVESSALVECSKPDTFSAPTDTANCGSFVATGVTLTRTTVIDHAARMADQTDVFTSTSGSHALDLDDHEAWYGSPGGTQTWQLPGQSAPSTHTTPEEKVAIAPQSAPASLLVERNPSLGGAGDAITDPRSGVSMWPIPDSATFVEAESREAYLHYTAAIPADAPLTTRRIYTHDWRVAEEAKLRLEAEDRLAGPAVAITAPAADGTVVAAPSLTLAGTSADNGGPPAVSVDGAPVTVGGDGTWSVVVPLVEGANQLVATADDGAGNTATATRTVTYTKPQPPPPPKKPTVGASGVVSCPAGGAACSVGATWTTVKAVAARKKSRKVVVARRTLTIAAGHKATVRPRLTKAGRKLLKKHRSVRVARRIRARAGTGAAVTRIRIVTIRRPRHG